MSSPPLRSGATRASAPPAWSGAVLACLFFVVATPWALRPWFLAADELPRDTSFFATVENADLSLNAWILTWGARAALVDPGGIFDGNIFFPAKNTLALSENMFAHLPITVPVYAWTESALAVLKAMALESFVLSGLAMFLFVQAATGNPGAALVAGAAFTFAPWRVNGFPHPQYLATAAVPVAFLAIDGWLEQNRRRWLALLAAAVAWQILASLYLGYFILFAAAAYAAVRIARGRGPKLQSVGALATAMAVGALCASPIAIPYLRARAGGLLPPFDPEQFAGHAWAPWDYVSLAFVQLAGVAVLALVGGDLGQRVVRRARQSPLGWTSRELALWAVVAVAVVLSTGPYVEIGSYELPTPYLFFYETIPGFSSIRGPRRFFIIVLAGLAALAGFAFARWTRRAPGWFQVGAGIVVSVACVVAAAPTPAEVRTAKLGGETQDVYRWLADQSEPGAVLELPAARITEDLVGAKRNADYMLASTTHWRPLLNGYSGYEPEAAAPLIPAMRELPRGEALRLLVNAVDFRFVVVHRDRLIGDEAERWNGPVPPGLEPVARFKSTDVYAVTAAPQPSWRHHLTAPQSLPRVTFEGLSTAPLAPECRSGEILAIHVPPTIALTAFPVAIPVEIANRSTCPWPAVAVAEDGLVGLSYQWIDPDGHPHPAGPRSRLLADVPSGASVREPVVVVPPHGTPGRWSLRITLEQFGVDPVIDQKLVDVDVAAMATR